MNENINTPIKKIAFTGLITAIIFILTIIIKIPSPIGGYLNAGDIGVLTAGVILGPIYGAIASAVASAASDLIFGSLIFAPGTFIIKGLMALICGLFYKKVKDNNMKVFVLFVICEAIMIIGYLGYDTLILSLNGIPEAISDSSLFAAIATDLAPNLIQGFIGVIGAIMLRKIFEDLLQKMNKEQ